MDIDAVTIACPRCRKAMDTYVRQADGGPLTADMCLECGGVWLDGAEVTRVYPALRGLGGMAHHRAPSPSRPIAACPRCGDPSRAVQFFDLELDHCPVCKGLWIDGSELDELAKTIDTHGGLPAADASSYRDGAASALRGDAVPCKRCQTHMSLEQVHPTSIGPLCAPCAAKHREEVMDTQLAGYEVPKNKLFELPKLEGFETSGGLLSAVGAVLKVALDAIDPPCAACGCHARSCCRHQRP